MRDRAPEKPPYGAPCNGCGFCCAAERCILSVEMIGAGPGPCPAMEFEQGRFWCGLVRNASRYASHVPEFADDAFRQMMMPYFGTGCDSDDPDGYRQKVKG